MRRRMPVLIALVLIGIVLVGAGILGWKVAERYLPTKEAANLDEVFDCEEGKVSIFLNNELRKEKALYVDNQTYFPLDWVNAYLNERYYWDSVEQKLVYAMPDQILSATAQSEGSDGKKLLLLEGENVYLSAGLLIQYTDLRMELFEASEHKRAFVDSLWESEERAVFRRDAAVRELGGAKSPVITTGQKGEEAVILERLDKWSKVRTVDGCIGYVSNRHLGSVQTVEQVSSFVQPEYTHISMEEPVCLVFHQVTNQDANNNLETLIAKTEGVNVVAPTWFSLKNNNGEFSSLGSISYVEKAHELGLQVWALLDNFSTDVNSKTLLTPTSVRQRLIQNLISEAKRLNLDGLNMDFEGIREEAGVPYVQFLRELSIACRREGLVLSIDDYVPTESTLFYNRKEQGTVADYVIVMGYDEHYEGGEAGPVASLSFVEQGIVDTLREVPKERLINAVPFYTRLWTESEEGLRSKALGIRAAQNWVNDNQVELTWDENLGLSYGEYQTEGQLQYLWMENAESLRKKAELVEKYELAGIACWKLGLETEDVWAAIQPLQ
ncbi:MAG: glycosyl hydrolase family 18 protein [bacterium]|nr:glycosyl hydrolase family 18 protein [bacterium]